MRKYVGAVGAVLFFCLLGSAAASSAGQSLPGGSDALNVERAERSVISAPGDASFAQAPQVAQGDPYPAEPCSAQTAECTVTWGAGTDVCKRQGTEGSCTTLYQGEHTTLDEAKARCEFAFGAGKGSGVTSCGPCHWVQSANGDPVEKCKKLCDKINERCIARCPRGDKGCMRRCNDEYGECLKECER